MKNHTGQEYTGYEQAFAYFNDHLFKSQLPGCLITLQRRRHAYGYFSPKRFVSRTNGHAKTDEIALNPDTFVECTDKEILSTLVHEMAHHWQAHFGKPGRRGYHNREWAKKMLGLGLRPVSHDRPGKLTGQRVSHEIVPGGAFDRSAEQLLATDFRLTWQSAPPADADYVGSLATALPLLSKIKYSCPACGRLNVWAKPKARLVCGQCLQAYVDQCEHLITPVEFAIMIARFGLQSGFDSLLADGRSGVGTIVPEVMPMN